jgi:spore coat protein A, manganese oxidase
MAAETGGRVDRIAVHLHGGLVTWTNDGGPFAWFSSANHKAGGFVHGSSFLNGAGKGAALYDYPNNQSARLIWYHDHAYSITRLNAYAGLASGYLITDDAEGQLIASGVLPNIPGYPLGIPLIIQDKTFVTEQAINAGYPGLQKTGSLWYPYVYESPGTGQPLPSMTLSKGQPLCDGTGRWDGGPGTPISAVPEYFSDTMLVNGAPYPSLPVAPRRFRFRVLNGSQARFLNLQLYVKDNTPDGIKLKRAGGEVDNNGNPILVPSNPAGPAMLQIGNEAGFLPAPVVLNNPPLPMGYYLPTNQADPRWGTANRYNLLLAPAERADLIIDFRGFEGRTIILYNDAPAPFPGGDIRDDYYPGAPDLSCIGGAATPRKGEGPDTRIIMQFVVSNGGSVSELSFGQTLHALNNALPIIFRDTQPPVPATGDLPKVKTLNEDFDNYGRLSQKLGSPDVADYLSSPKDTAYKGETQVWQIFNLTGDTHPMHFHLVNVQVVQREAWQWTIDTAGETVPVLPLAVIPGTAREPDPNERGWKETVRMNPGEVTTVVMKFDMPSGAPPSPRLQASYGVTGAEYVWHCHILEHEEHDMMHALVVL